MTFTLQYTDKKYDKSLFSLMMPKYMHPQVSTSSPFYTVITDECHEYKMQT